MMETKQIISWLYDKAARAQDHSYARMLNQAAKRLRELDEAQSVTQDVTQSAVNVSDTNVVKWIPVTERLPDNKEHDWVLAQVVEDNGFMHIPKVMEYRQQRNDWFEETYGWLSEHNGAFIVTHWMPLPEPPKEVE
jgi:hypothetical protein